MKLKKCEEQAIAVLFLFIQRKENQINNECVKTRMSGIFGGGDLYEKYPFESNGSGAFTEIFKKMMNSVKKVILNSKEVFTGFIWEAKNAEVLSLQQLSSLESLCLWESLWLCSASGAWSSSCCCSNKWEILQWNCKIRTLQ